MSYGCYNRAHFRATLEVQDGWNKNGTRRMVTVPVRSEPDCMYDLKDKDKRCEGCRHAQTQ